MPNTLTGAFSRIAAESPERVAMLAREGDAVRAWTCGEINAGALAVARWLSRQGIGKGDRVAIVLENRPEWCICYFGILFAGAIAVPLDTQAGADEIRRAVGQARCRAMVMSGKLASPEGTALERVIVVDPQAQPRGTEITLREVVATDDWVTELPTADPGDTASIIFTSGTTGSPKGAMLTHSNFYSNMESLSQLGYLRPDDNFLSILPLHHAFPFLVTLVLPLLSGARISYLSPLKPALIMDCIRAQGVTVLVVTPQVLRLFHKTICERLSRLPGPARRLFRISTRVSRGIERLTGFNPARPLLRPLRAAVGPQFRYFVCGGAKLDPELARDFFSWGFTVLEGYGLTETSPVAAMNHPGAFRIGSAGKAIPGVAIAVDNPDARGVGEILIKGPNVMKGYDRDEAATRGVIIDGWLHTGDLGRIDRDGYLYIEGRIKEVIVLSSGKKVSAEEVEAHYREAPSVKELCVFADHADEKVVAAVVPDLDYFRESGESNIRDRVRWDLEYYSERLAPYKRLKDFILVEDLPRTPLGKIKRYESRSAYLAHAVRKGRTGGAPLEGLSAAGERALAVLKEETGSREIAGDDRLELDLGIDSLGRVSLMTALEKVCGIVIREEEFLPLLTVSELIRYVECAAERGGERIARGERSWSDIVNAGLPAALARSVSLEVGPLSRLLTFSVSLVVGVVCVLYFRLTVRGREHLGEGSCIICPNHTSYLDGFLIFTALPLGMKYRLFFLGLRNYFEVPVLRSMLRSLRIIPVDPARNIVETLQASAFVLKHGKVLCVFPEGARSITGELKEFKKGVAILAKEAGAQIVPAYIDGSHRAWKPGTWLPRPRTIAVVFGRAQSFDDLVRRSGPAERHGDEYERASAGLRAAVVALLGRTAL